MATVAAHDAPLHCAVRGVRSSRQTLTHRCQHRRRLPPRCDASPVDAATSVTAIRDGGADVVVRDLDIFFLASANHATTLDLGAVHQVMVDGSVLPVFLSSSVVHTSNVDAVDENARVSFTLGDAAVPSSRLAGDPLHLRVQSCQRCR